MVNSQLIAVCTFVPEGSEGSEECGEPAVYVDYTESLFQVSVPQEGYFGLYTHSCAKHGLQPHGATPIQQVR